MSVQVAAGGSSGGNQGGAGAGRYDNKAGYGGRDQCLCGSAIVKPHGKLHCNWCHEDLGSHGFGIHRNYCRGFTKKQKLHHKKVISKKSKKFVPPSQLGWYYSPHQQQYRQYAGAMQPLMGVVHQPQLNPQYAGAMQPLMGVVHQPQLNPQYAGAMQPLMGVVHQPQLNPQYAGAMQPLLGVVHQPQLNP
ncbi:hypothetical protein PENTCL1PPCAC_5287, partial [Pristionchus entomophagus]